MSNRAKILLIIFIVLGITNFPNKSSGLEFKLFDNSLFLSGFLENKIAVRTQNHALGNAEAGDLSMWRDTIQIEPTYVLSENLKFSGIFRYWVENCWDIDDDINQMPKHKMHRSKGNEILREYYMDLKFKNLFIRLGKQQVVWGESDGLRMSDIVNPLDISYHYFFESWEDIRIPEQMINIVYTILPKYNLSGQLIFIPDDWHPTRLAREGAPWALAGVNESILHLMRTSWPHDSVSDRYQIGGRLKGIFSGVEVALFNFYTRAQSPVFNLSKLFAGQPPFEYRRINITGGSFNFFNEFTKSVIRGECAFTKDQPFNNITSDKIFEKNTFAYMLGFDRPTMIRCLNPNKSFYISGQLFQKFIFNWKHHEQITTGDMSHDRYLTMITFLVNTNYFEMTSYEFAPQLFMAYDLSGSWWWQPQITWTPNFSWAFILGGNFMTAPTNYDSSFGAVRNNDEVLFTIRYKFS